MVGTISERRDKWCLDNGVPAEDFTLQDSGAGLFVPLGQPATQPDLEAIPDQTMQDYLDGLAAAQEQKDTDATQLLYELSESELQWWINTDKATRDSAINAATTDPGLRSLHKKEADAIAAIASILNLLRKGGLFDAYLP